MLYTCTFFLIFFPLIFLGRGFVCLQKNWRAGYRRTMNDIEREKDTNERRNAIENDLRAFDDEDAFASPMDCDKYENEFSSLLLLDEEETEEERNSGGKLRYSSTWNAGAQWKNEWPIKSAELLRTRVRENRNRFHLGADGLAVRFDSFAQNNTTSRKYET